MNKLKDLTGIIFNHWTVISRATSNKYGRAMWNCKCICGTKRIVHGGSLLNGNSKSCGCRRAELYLIDLTGQSFGRWTVISQAPSNIHGQTMWNCRCVCGIYGVVTCHGLRCGKSVSCGCFNREQSSIANNGTGNPMYGRRGSKAPAYGTTGSKNPNWKGGITPEDKRIRNSIEYRLWREAVFARDNWTCQECGMRGGKLNAHHIKSFADYPKLHLAIDNGITLCEKCHTDLHISKKADFG